MATFIDLISRAGLQYKDRGTGVGPEHVNINCPFHYPRDVDTLMGVHQTDLWFHCWYCGEKGQWGKLRRKLAQQYPGVDWNSVEVSGRDFFIDEAQRLPPEIAELTEPLSLELVRAGNVRHTRVWKYLTGTRDLEPELLSRINVGVGKRKLDGYVTFPTEDQVVARKIVKDSRPRYMREGPKGKPFVWGLPYVAHEQPDWVALTEGVFDCLSLPLGHAIAILGSVSSDKWLGPFIKATPRTRAVLGALDQGVPKRTRDKIKLTLRDCGYEFYDWNWQHALSDWDMRDGDPPKDLNEMMFEYGRKHLHTLALQQVGYEVDDDKRGSLL